MANTKNNKKPTEVEKVESKKDEIEEIKENENKESEEVSALKAQLEEMKNAMAELMSKQNQNVQVVYDKGQEGDVVIGCRVLQGVGWGDPSDISGEVRLRYNEEQSVPVSDMKRFFRKYSIRKLFEDGLCYFAEPNDYAIFNIKNYIDLSDENLSKILTQSNVNDIINSLNKITTNKKDSGVVNCLIFRICDMIRNNKLEWDYYTRKAVESYFGTEFDRGISTLIALDKMKA